MASKSNVALQAFGEIDFNVIILSLIFLTYCTIVADAILMPSQVIDDKGYDGAKADLWSCGVILFVLMAGYLPFDEPSLMTLYKKVCFSLKRVKRYFFPLILVLDLLG